LQCWLACCSAYVTQVPGFLQNHLPPAPLPLCHRRWCWCGQGPADQVSTGWGGCWPVPLPALHPQRHPSSWTPLHAPSSTDVRSRTPASCPLATASFAALPLPAAASSWTTTRAGGARACGSPPPQTCMQMRCATCGTWAATSRQDQTACLAACLIAWLVGCLAARLFGCVTACSRHAHGLPSRVASAAQQAERICFALPACLNQSCAHFSPAHLLACPPAGHPECPGA